MSLFEEIRSAAAEVTRRATLVQIVGEGVDALADSLAAEASAESIDPAHWPFDDAETTIAFVVTLDAVNFGSGWFPVLDKLPGRSGYLTISTRLREHFERNGAWSADELRALSTSRCTQIFGQRPDNAEASELMALFARSLSDVGKLLDARGMRSFTDLVDAAHGSAERLVRLLTEMPLYRDVARYEALEVPFYKRAQITAADLAHVFEQRGPGCFGDLDALTMFADNLVPHVLRCSGALQYDPDLLARIDRAELIPPGSQEEVEIRAVALHAVEQIAQRLSSRGVGEPSLPARRIDQMLWSRGQSPEIKARNRHRTRSVYY